MLWLNHVFAGRNFDSTHFAIFASRSCTCSQGPAVCTTGRPLGQPVTPLTLSELQKRHTGRLVLTRNPLPGARCLAVEAPAVDLRSLELRVRALQSPFQRVDLPPARGPVRRAQRALVRNEFSDAIGQLRLVAEQEEAGER